MRFSSGSTIKDEMTIDKLGTADTGGEYRRPDLRLGLVTMRSMRLLVRCLSWLRRSISSAPALGSVTPVVVARNLCSTDVIRFSSCAMSNPSTISQPAASSSVERVDGARSCNLCKFAIEFLRTGKTYRRGRLPVGDQNFNIAPHNFQKWGF